MTPFHKHLESLAIKQDYLFCSHCLTTTTTNKAATNTLHSLEKTPLVYPRVTNSTLQVEAMSEKSGATSAKKALTDSVTWEEVKLVIDQAIESGTPNNMAIDKIKDDVAVQALSYAIEVLYAKQGQSDQVARDIARKYPKRALKVERTTEEQLCVPTYTEMRGMDTDQIKTEVIKVVGQIVKVVKDIREMGNEVAKFEKK